ncbi:MAG: hypothetical protein AVDCRST_MAG30-1575, partial [uncultured Solirubrobacteraceae bacterium]
GRARRPGARGRPRCDRALPRRAARGHGERLLRRRRRRRHLADPRGRRAGGARLLRARADVRGDLERPGHRRAPREPGPRPRLGPDAAHRAVARGPRRARAARRDLRRAVLRADPRVLPRPRLRRGGPHPRVLRRGRRQGDLPQGPDV